MAARQNTARTPGARCNWQRALRLGLALVLVCFDPGLFARAQTTASTAVVVPLRLAAPPSIIVTPGQPAPLPIAVSPLESLPPNAFVRIKGLPQGAALTEGYAVAPGTWAVALNALANLKAQFPAMPEGRGEALVQLVSVEGAVLVETPVSLVYGAAAPSPPPPPQQQRPAIAPAPTPPPARAAEPPSKLSPEEQQKAERMVAQGDRFLESGNVSVARQYYKRAADAGLAAGALKLAGTYDPVELDRIAAQGVVPQPEEARRWYERALALGAREAKERLARLATMN